MDIRQLSLFLQLSGEILALSTIFSSQGFSGRISYIFTTIPRLYTFFNPYISCKDLPSINKRHCIEAMSFESYTRNIYADFNWITINRSSVLIFYVCCDIRPVEKMITVIIQSHIIIYFFPCL